MKDRLAEAVGQVVRNDLCTGCGACAAMFERVEMRDVDGFLRPVIAGPAAADGSGREAAAFQRVCPGLGIDLGPAETDSREHDVFGRHVSVWRGWAADPSIRRRGSSGGVLSALAGWIAKKDPGSHVTAVREDASAPLLSTVARLTSTDDPSSIAGSRYAPVAALERLDVADPPAAVVGKPCEVAALTAMQREGALPDAPLRLTFFCAGTSRWAATLKALAEVDVERDETVGLRYRGDGWPGRFTATTRSGEARSLDYDRAWGKILGRDLQTRCKLCIDGTGELGDISVGDYWKTDERGYPVFTEGDGDSVVIARTARGHEMLQRARAAGVLVLEPLELESVVAVQPLQVERRSTIGARLLGRRLAGFRPPRYRGWRLSLVHRVGWRRLIRTALGTAARSLGLRRKEGVSRPIV